MAKQMRGGVPDPKAAMVERDRKICLRYVRLRESKKAAKIIHAELEAAGTPVPLRTIYNALGRELKWARSVIEAEAGKPGPAIEATTSLGGTECVTQPHHTTPPRNNHEGHHEKTG